MMPNPSPAPLPTAEELADWQRFIEDACAPSSNGPAAWDEAVVALGRVARTAMPALLQAVATLTRERDEARERAAHAEDFIQSEGYSPCQIAACNCNRWHGGHNRRMLDDARDKLADAQADLADTEAKLRAETELVSDQAALETALATAQERIRALEEIDKARAPSVTSGDKLGTSRDGG